MDKLHLSVENTLVDDKIRITTYLQEDGISKKIKIFHELDRIVKFDQNRVLDGHILCVLLYAMSRGKPLKVHGFLSQDLMRNIEELQSMWRWDVLIYTKK